MRSAEYFASLALAFSPPKKSYEQNRYHPIGVARPGPIDLWNPKLDKDLFSGIPHCNRLLYFQDANCK